MAEIFFYSDNPLYLHFSYCAKTPFAFDEIFPSLIMPRLTLCLVFPSLIGELAAHIAIFVKLSKIEARAEVYEIRGNRLVSRMRHQRNVVRDPIQLRKKLAQKNGLISNFHYVKCLKYKLWSFFCHVGNLKPKCKSKTQANFFSIEFHSSILGHFISFLFNITQRVAFVTGLFLTSEEVMPSLRALILFLAPCVNFFLYPLIETMFSDTLRQTLCSQY